jgi:hypothetical protein
MGVDERVLRCIALRRRDFVMLHISLLFMTQY